MKRAVTTAVLTVLFAVAAAAAVFLYIESARQRAESGGRSVPVVISTVDIPAGQDLDPLIRDGAFQVKDVPSEDLLEGVIQDVAALRGQRTAYPILAGEQVSAARLRGALQAAGGAFGLHPGMQAWSVSLDADRLVSGQLREGDHVEVYGTFDVPSQTNASITRVLVPDARVLWTSSPADGATVAAPASGQIGVTLEVSPAAAELLTYAVERGAIWATLLPPNEHGVHVSPVVSKGMAAR